MPETSNINLSVSSEQVFKLAQQLPVKDKIELIYLLEQEQYIDNISEAHKKLVGQRIKKYDRNPELLIEEAEALKLINEM
ncbi:MAG: hypothetical protein ABI359_01810 [Ginsengibacter sp.]